MSDQEIKPRAYYDGDDASLDEQPNYERKRSSRTADYSRTPRYPESEGSTAQPPRLRETSSSQARGPRVATPFHEMTMNELQAHARRLEHMWCKTS